MLNFGIQEDVFIQISAFIILLYIHLLVLFLIKDYVSYIKKLEEVQSRNSAAITFMS